MNIYMHHAQPFLTNGGWSEVVMEGEDAFGYFEYDRDRGTVMITAGSDNEYADTIEVSLEDFEQLAVLLASLCTYFKATPE